MTWPVGLAAAFGFGFGTWLLVGPNPVLPLLVFVGVLVGSRQP